MTYHTQQGAFRTLNRTGGLIPFGKSSYGVAENLNDDYATLIVNYDGVCTDCIGRLDAIEEALTSSSYAAMPLAIKMTTKAVTAYWGIDDLHMHRADFDRTWAYFELGKLQHCRADQHDIEWLREHEPYVHHWRSVHFDLAFNRVLTDGADGSTHWCNVPTKCRRLRPV